MDTNLILALQGFMYLALGTSVFLFVYEGWGLFRFGVKQYEEKYLSKAQQELDEMFLLFTPEQFLYLNVLAIGILGILAYLLTRSIPVTILAAMVGLLVPRIALAVMKRARLKKFEEQLVDALSTMSNSLKAGFSLVQTFELVAREMTPPISQEFGLMLRENKLGVHLDKALQNLARRVKSNNLDLVVTSIVIARQAGGNLSEIFETIANTIREIARLEGKIDALTSQGRLQAIVLFAMLFVIFLSMNFIDPELFSVIYTDPLGWGVIGVIMILVAFGGFLIWRIVSIEV